MQNTQNTSSPLSPPLRREHVNELTGLRGIAAFLVVIHHLLVLLPPLKEGPLLPVLKHCGILGMSLFFTLSGFVIFYNYAELLQKNPAKGIKSFFLARFARLFPLYAFFLGGFFIFNALFAGQDLNEFFACAITLPLWMLGMQSWFYGFINDIPLVFLQGRASLLWSVSTELALYCFFIPLCFLLVRVRKVWHMCAAVALVTALHLAYIRVAGADGALTEYMNETFSVYKEFAAWKWLLYHAPTGRLFEFIMGCLAAIVYLHGKKSAHVTNIFAALAWLMLCGIVAVNVYPLPVEQAFMGLPLLAVGFVFCLAQCTSRLLCMAPMVYLGEISYSTYLLQAIFLQFLQYRGESLSLRLCIVTLYILGTYALAHIAYTKLEMPARRKVRDMFKERC